MRLDEPDTESGDSAAGGGCGTGDQPLFARGAVTRTFDTPGFRGMTFYEVQAKSIVNRVPATSRMAFTWTINPYRGCQHSCVYCFARNTHTYLDLDAGHDFDSKVVVKVNAPELLRKKLASANWQGEHIAMGTNVDCYQRAEGKYQLMRGIISALRDAKNPFSILTKGTLILRDLDLLTQAAQVTEVGLNVSAGFIDKELWRTLEPGTPSPERRLDTCKTLTEAGLRCGVLMGPIVPFLSDSPEQLDAAVRRIADSGAVHVTPIVLHLRPGTREWYLRWLNDNHPELVRRYLRFYGRGAYAPKAYQSEISGQVRELAQRYGVGATSPAAEPPDRATTRSGARAGRASQAGPGRPGAAAAQPAVTACDLLWRLRSTPGRPRSVRAGGVPGRAHQAHGADLVAAGRAQGRRVDVDADRGRERGVGQVVHLPPAHAPGHSLRYVPDLGEHPVQDRDALFQLAPGHHQHARRSGVVVPARGLPRQPRLQPHVVVGRAVKPLVPAVVRVHAHQPLPRPGRPGDLAGDLLHPRSAQRLAGEFARSRPAARSAARSRIVQRCRETRPGTSWGTR